MRKDLENSYGHIVFLVRLLHKSDPQYVVTAILMELGIPAKHEGYHYLKAAILQYNSGMMCMVNARLYQLIAEQWGASAISVEKAIRSTIKAGWQNRQGKMWEYYFPGIDMDDSKAPSNHMFIAEVSRVLELWEGLRQTYEYELRKKEVSYGIK